MADFKNIDANEKQLGNLLQIIFSQGVRLQISEDYRDWEMVNKLRAKVSPAREYKFMLQSSLGMAAIQSRNPGTTNRQFPSSQKIRTSEHTAKFKQLQATIELDYDTWDRARKSPEKYAEPLALEMQSKTTGAKRLQAARLYQDGTGVVGTVSATTAPVPNPATGTVTFALSTIAPGFVGFFEYEDLYVLRKRNGNPSTGTVDESDLAEPTAASAGNVVPYAWQMVEKDREADTVELLPLDSSLNAIPLFSATITNFENDAVFYRIGQEVIPSLDEIADYGDASDALIGLESLAAADGRSVYGITMSGATAGSRTSAQGQPLDVTHIHKALDKAKLRVGRNAYSWKMMTMSPEAQLALIESRETDRRFNSVEDATRGTRKFIYQHEQDAVETVTSEYVRKNKIWMLPETKSGKKVLEYAGSDFETVKAPGGSDFHLKVYGGSYVNAVESYLNAYCLMVCKHPAAIASVDEFTL